MKLFVIDSEAAARLVAVEVARLGNAGATVVEFRPLADAGLRALVISLGMRYAHISEFVEVM